ncbi:MAG TPA: cytochrome c [Bryobacteraceae bacterium]|nr:cytochrome c [Bryobacteraceae bacterium]
MKLKGSLNLSLVLLSGLMCVACRDDMHDQPRYKPLAATDFFGDGRSARPEVPGTVARGQLKTDLARYTGKVNDQEVDYFPFPITRADLERGQDRFNVYCSPCHSRLGDGNGLVVQRGFRRPPSYHIDRLIKAPVGHFFDVATNGYGAMPEYRSRVPVDDRWRIVAYIRALQLSQRATLDDVPADRRNELDKTPATPPPGPETTTTPAPGESFPRPDADNPQGDMAR